VRLRNAREEHSLSLKTHSPGANANELIRQHGGPIADESDESSCHLVVV
jgi:hypothetical protein